MHNIDNETLWQMMGEQVQQIVPADKKDLFIDAIKPVIESADEGLFWARILCTDELTHGDEGRAVVCSAGHAFYDAAGEAIDEHDGDFDYFCRHITEKTGAAGQDLEMPLRIALTGVLHGPDLVQVFHLVGPVQCKVRFEQVMDLCHSH
jgi:hypothetical protein